MLRKARNWLERTFSPKTSPTPEQAERSAATARHDRTGVLTDLRSEVRRLQQEIKDVSDALDGPAGDGRTAHEKRLATLHRELEQKQRELSRLQARV